jgi:predicted AlkP superfamily phosphohydrolase/phosphomutase
MPRRRAIVVALDGLGIDLLAPALAAGGLPALAELAGADGPIAVAARPPASPQAAWTTFTTASNPGRHGIFGLTHPGRQLRIRVTSADHVRMPTLWERAATDGLQSVVVGLPGTYPARRMSGALVAGYVVADEARLAHPRSLAPRPAASGYRSDVDVSAARDDPDRFTEELRGSVAARIEVMRELISSDRWSLAILAFPELDRWGHAMRRRAAAGDEQASAALGGMLEAIDAFVGELRRAHPAARMLALSAHGVAAVDRTLNIEAWLVEGGYLRPGPDGRPGEGTAAFSMESGRIYLHAARMFEAGRLGGGSVMPLMDEIGDGLTGLRADDGSRPLDAVLRRRDLYDGPHARVGPHLVAAPAQGWAVVSSHHIPTESRAGRTEGAHRHDLGFVLGDLKRESAAPSLENLGATVLSHLGLYAADVEGRAVSD